MKVINCGKVKIVPEIINGEFKSIGEISIDGKQIRSTKNRFLPWFDTYKGDIFKKFQFVDIIKQEDNFAIITKAISDPDVLFREQRDSSGDLCFRDTSWDETPLEASLKIVFQPVEKMIEGHSFYGFKYWFEYESDEIEIHRFIDRQTWEIGGSVEGINVCLRNWCHKPLTRLSREESFSTGGLVESFFVALPGNLWARWSLLPAFDMQYSNEGTLLGWFDEVSLIRTLVESSKGEDKLRVIDMHLFEKNKIVKTNPKTIMYSTDVLDDIDAVNLWTRVNDQEKEKACKQFGIKEDIALRMCLHHVEWRDYNLDTTYEDTLDMAQEFGMDEVYVDPVWQHGEAYNQEIKALIPEEKLKGTVIDMQYIQNVCCTYEFNVADIYGGEAALKRLCDRAKAKGLKITSWAAAHYTPRRDPLLDERLGPSVMNVFATKESGAHPDTGYAADLWPVKLNTYLMEKIRDQIIGVCKRTGLSGFLWDSFSNLGWWQVDYWDGSMKPQFERMAQMFSDFEKNDIYIRPEALVAFTSHSCVGMCGGNHYPVGIQSCYSYDTQIGFAGTSEEDTDELDMFKGKLSTDMLFHWIANRHVPGMAFRKAPREQWDEKNVAEIKDILKMYKTVRDKMVKRTVLKDVSGILWEDGSEEKVLFSFVDMMYEGAEYDALTKEAVNGAVKANRTYIVK